MNSYDHILGSLLGVAIGDALGATYEFMPMSKAGKAPCADLLGGGYFGWRPGQPTDDTDQTLIVAHALAEAVSLDDVVGDVTSGLIKWHDNRPVDEGTTTGQALELLSCGRRQVFSRASRKSQANGSLMRAAPVGFIPDEDRRRTLAGKISAITHGSNRCITLCAQYADAISYLMQGGSYDWANFTTDDPRKWYDGGGWVQDSWDIAWWALAEAHYWGDPVGALCEVVRLGGDADTNAAIAGGLIGAEYGRDIWPTAWLNQLETHDEIRKVAAAINDKYWKADT